MEQYLVLDKFNATGQNVCNEEGQGLVNYSMNKLFFQSIFSPKVVSSRLEEDY